MFNFLTAFLCLLGPLFSRASTETGEIELLKSLYDSTSGPSWIYPSGTLSANKWNFANDNDPCASNFAGLTCYSMGATDYISSIALPGFNLQGFMDVDYEGFKNLTTLVLTDNKLTGFSDGVGKSTTLRTLALNKNSISGLLPTLASMSSLDTLLLNNNVMSGSLSGRLPDAPRLTVIDVSNNKFSGAKWSQLLGYPSASFISAGFNCFDSATVNLAEACSISSLEMLYLSSVGSGCRERIWAWQARNLNRVENTVPACLLTLPNLKTLTLADNGFSGTLTAEEPGAKLKSLDLSRNDLTGNIPMQLQKSVPSMESLDLSHNRLDGEISRLCDASSAFGTCTENNAVKLSYNHLSGKLSENINFCGVVDVLGGNLFSCALSGSDALPNKDPNFVEYRCGSEDYDASLYFYAVSFFLFFLTIVYVLVANYHVYTNLHTYKLTNYIEYHIPTTAYKHYNTNYTINTNPIKYKHYYTY